MPTPKSTFNETAVLNTETMFGENRQDLLARVKNTIANETDSTVYFFVGIGGIGKTRLLQEIGRLINFSNQPTRWSGVIDLYQSEMHSNPDIEIKLAQNLDPKDEYFGAYHKMRREFESQLMTGFGGSGLEKNRQELTKKFTACLQEMSKDFRIVLTFDTLELVQYEYEDIQTLCEVKDENSSIKSWLLSQIPLFTNTVTVLSGRQHRQLQAELQECFQDTICIYHSFAVDRLSKPDARLFLQALATKCSALANIDDSLFEQIYLGSENGRPIYLSLAADLAARRGQILSELFQNPRVLRQQIASRLLNDLPEQHSEIIKYLAFARQGLDVPLLLYLTRGGMSQKRANDLFTEMRRYTFIKHAESQTHPTGQLFLHDEVYDILDQERLRAMDEETQPIFEKLRQYYAHKQMSLTYELQTLQKEKDSYKKSEREEKQRDLENMMIRQLYYELQLNPLTAYWRYYNRWSEEAIKSHRTGFDMRLQDVVLNFFRYAEKGYLWQKENQSLHSRFVFLYKTIAAHEEAFKRNSVLLWVRRYIARGDNSKANRIAEKIEKDAENSLGWAKMEDRLCQTALIVVKSEARNAIGASKDETLEMLQRVPEILRSETDFADAQKDERWRYFRILGRANHMIGHTHRLESQFSTAIGYYQRSIALYRRIDVLDEMAATVTNLAYVYAQLGAIDEAEALAEDAISIWNKLGRPYNLALSLNARGLICLLADQPHRAKAFCTQANGLFSELIGESGYASDLRGRGLAQLGLGEAYRRLGNLRTQNVYSLQEAVQFYMKGRDCLQTALGIFKDQSERDTLSSCAELGRLYRDWAIALLKAGQTQDAVERQYQAEDFLKKARQMAQEKNANYLVADISQDLITLYWETSQKDLAQSELKSAMKLIDPTYLPAENNGFTQIEKPLDAYWQVLGKLFLLRAQMALDYAPPLLETLDEAVRMFHIQEGILYFVQAVACFHQYTSTISFSQSPKMKLTKTMIYQHFKSYKASRLLKVVDYARNTAVQYQVVTELDDLISYMERTLGTYIQLRS